MSQWDDTSSNALNGWMKEIGASEVLRAVADAMPAHAFFVVDSNRRILLWSRGAEQLLGFTADSVVGEDCHVANRCQQCNVGCGLSEVGELTDRAMTLYSSAGESIPIRKTARAFYGTDGEFLGGVEILHADAAETAPQEEEPRTNELQSFDNIEEFHGLYCRNPQMAQVFQTIRNVAETDATILVRGDSGTGKELVARAIHQESHRAQGPFVPINCAALTPNLLESELFGHVRGAFTGAISDRIGLFKQADGGTLFLDEVAELPIDLQAKLLRVIETREVIPVGGSATTVVDVRLVAATHRSLRREVAAGRFREDLMFRLRVVPLFIPPLKQRLGDVELLLWRFIEGLNERGPRRVSQIHPAAMRAILDYHWPGNVRELRNVVEYGFAVGRGAELLLSELPPEFRDDDPVHPILETEDEKSTIRRALAGARGNIGRAAETLGISRATLWRKRKKYAL